MRGATIKILYIGVENFDIDVIWRRASKKEIKAGF